MLDQQGLHGESPACPSNETLSQEEKFPFKRIKCFKFQLETLPGCVHGIIRVPAEA